jgi:hypothetical protein
MFQSVDKAGVLAETEKQTVGTRFYLFCTRNVLPVLPQDEEEEEKETTTYIRVCNNKNKAKYKPSREATYARYMEMYRDS